MLMNYTRSDDVEFYLLGILSLTYSSIQKGKHLLEDLDVGGEKILKWMLDKYDGVE